MPNTDLPLAESLKEAMDEARLKAASDVLDGIIADSKHNITEQDEFNDTIAETNATNWDIDDYTLDDVQIDQDNTIKVSLSFSASGESLEDRPLIATNLNGTAIATIDESGKVSYEIISIELDRGNDEDDEKSVDE